MDEKTAQQVKKFRQALADAREKAQADEEFAKKLPAIEGKLIERLKDLGVDPETGELPAAQPPKQDESAAATDGIDPALQEKYAKLLKALKAAEQKAEEDAAYKADKFPAIEAKLKGQIHELEVKLGFATEPAKEGKA
jgi:hypothetical protein